MSTISKGREGIQIKTGSRNAKKTKLAPVNWVTPVTDYSQIKTPCIAYGKSPCFPVCPGVEFHLVSRKSSGGEFSGCNCRSSLTTCAAGLRIRRHVPHRHSRKQGRQTHNQIRLECIIDTSIMTAECELRAHTSGGDARYRRGLSAVVKHVTP